MPGPTACEAGIALTRRPANDRCPASDSAGADGPNLSAAWLNCPGVRAHAAAPQRGVSRPRTPSGRPLCRCLTDGQTTPAPGLSLDGGSDGYVAILPDHRPGLARRRLARLTGAAGPRGCHAGAGPVSPQFHSERYQRATMRNAEYGLVWPRPTQAQAARSHARQRRPIAAWIFVLGRRLALVKDKCQRCLADARCMHWLSACRPSPVSLGGCLYALGARVISLSGIEALGRANSCRAREGADAILAILAEQAQATDLIVITQESMSTVLPARPRRNKSLGRGKPGSGRRH